ncbi:Uma2 family endonuclease [Streptosporangium lutulentum]
MSPSGTPQHARIARRLSRALIPVEDKNDWESFSGDVDVCIEGPRDTLVPDYCLAPVNAPLWGDRELLSSTLIMVAEIVSPGSTDTDRAVKPRIYAGCGIPIVLIIDPVASPPAITVLSDPVEGTYRTTTNTEMGKPVRLPSPSTSTSTPRSSFSPGRTERQSEPPLGCPPPRTPASARPHSSRSTRQRPETPAGRGPPRPIRRLRHRTR